MEGGTQQQLDVGEQEVEHRQAGGNQQLKACALKGQRCNQIGCRRQQDNRRIGEDAHLEGCQKVALFLLIAALLRTVAQSCLGDTDSIEEHNIISYIVNISQQSVVRLGKKTRQKKNRNKSCNLCQSGTGDDMEKAALVQSRNSFAQLFPIHSNFFPVHAFSFLTEAVVIATAAVPNADECIWRHPQRVPVRRSALCSKPAAPEPSGTAPR